MFKISAAIYCPGLLSDLKQLTIMALEGKKKNTQKTPHLFKLLWLWRLYALPIQMSIFMVMFAFELCY